MIITTDSVVAGVTYAAPTWFALVNGGTLAGGTVFVLSAGRILAQSRRRKQAATVTQIHPTTPTHVRASLSKEAA